MWLGTLAVGMLLLGEAPECGAVRCSGKRISGFLDLNSFCVPRGMRVVSSTGEHGDVHHTVRYRGYELRLASGLWFSAKKREEFVAEWDVRSWVSPHGERRDYRRAVGGRRSRYVTLAPNGWVEYTDVPERVAAAFDGVLDSVCWRPLGK